MKSAVVFILAALSPIMRAAPGGAPQRRDGITIATNDSSGEEGPLSTFNPIIGPLERRVEHGLNILSLYGFRKGYNLATVSINTHRRAPASRIEDFNRVSIQVARPADHRTYTLYDNGDGEGWQGPLNQRSSARIWNWNKKTINFESAMDKLNDVGVKGPWTTVLLHMVDEDPFTGKPTNEPFFAFFNIQKPFEITYVGAWTGRAITGLPEQVTLKEMDPIDESAQLEPA